MENRSHALIAGIFTVVLLTLAISLGVWLGRDKIKRMSYEIVTDTPVAGLNVQAAVRYKGLKVGNVTDIRFDADKPGQIILNLAINPDTPVTQTTYATLAYQGVTGLAFIQLNDVAQPGALVTAVKSEETYRIPLKAGTLQNIEERGMAILQQTQELTSRVNALLAPENQKMMMATMEQYKNLAQAWQQVPGQLQPTLAQLPTLTNNLNGTLVSFKSSAQDISLSALQVAQLAQQLQSPEAPINQSLRAITELTHKLNYETLPQLQQLTRQANSSMQTAKTNLQQLQQRPQSLLWGPGKPQPGPGEPGFSSSAETSPPVSAMPSK